MRKSRNILLTSACAVILSGCALYTPNELIASGKLHRTRTVDLAFPQACQRVYQAARDEMPTWMFDWECWPEQDWPDRGEARLVVKKATSWRRADAVIVLSAQGEQTQISSWASSRWAQEAYIEPIVYATSE